MQTLLADRFKLRAHPEIQDGPGFALTLDKGRPKLQSATGGEEAYDQHVLSMPSKNRRRTNSEGFP